MKIIILLVSIASLFSCSNMEEINFDLFKSTSNYYKSQKDKKSFSSLTRKQSKKFTASFRNQSVTDFSIWFTNTFQKGIVFDESLRNKDISAEFVEADEKEIINIVSKMFDLEPNTLGNTYYIGKFKQEDRGILVRQIQSLSSVDVEKIINSVNANQGKFTVTETGVLIVADRESVLTRISNLFDSLDGIDIKKYVVNFYFIDLNVSELESKGVDLTTSGTFSADLAYNSSSLLSQVDQLTTVANFNISGFVEYLNSNSFGKLTSTPLFVCYDNINAEISRGETLPIPKRIVSPEGTVTTDFEQIAIGESINCLVRSAGIDKVLLNLKYSNSEIIELINNEVPRTSDSKFSTSAILQTDKLYLLGEMVSNDQRETESSFFYTNEKKINKTQIFVKIIKI